MDENKTQEIAEKEFSGQNTVEETVTQIRGEMQQQAQAHQQQMQQMMNMFGQAIQHQGGSVGQSQEAPAELPSHLETLGIDEDDPYAEQFVALKQQLESSQSELQNVKQQFGDFNLNAQRASLSQQVDSALSEQKVPDMLKDNVRQVVYAYMAQTSEPVNPATLVENWMQSLGQYVEAERKDWAKDAGRSRRIAAVGGAPGILKDKPKSWSDAKAASFAMLLGHKP
jgi:hypothetical protein